MLDIWLNLLESNYKSYQGNPFLLKVEVAIKKYSAAQKWKWKLEEYQIKPKLALSRCLLRLLGFQGHWTVVQGTELKQESRLCLTASFQQILQVSPTHTKLNQSCGIEELQALIGILFKQ